jgi:hypothetical protein
MLTVGRYIDFLYYCVVCTGARGDVISAARYKELCRIANPQYPEMLLLGGVGLFGTCND